MRFRLYNPTNRKTPAHIVELGPHEFFWSYETCIAYRGPLGQWRIDNHWGPTTGRHFRELGCRDFEIVSDKQFEETIEKALGLITPETV